MDKNNFQVVITNQLKPDQDKLLITRKLAALFRIDEQKAAQFLIKPRTVIKDNLDEATAKKYLAAIQQTGAHCEIINKKDADLPQIVEPAITEPTTAQPRPTAHATTRPRQEPELTLVAREQKIEKDTREKLATLQHASEETLCPQCGTIRGSIDAVCLHCGYNPLEPAARSTSGLKKLITLVIVIAVVAAAALFAGLPYFQKYMAHKKLGEDLNLAFEVRNKVAEFIEKTGFFPNQNMDASLPDRISNDSIQAIVVGSNATITVTLRPEAANNTAEQTIIFTPKLHQGKIIWNCMQGTLSNEFRPEVCRN